MKTMFESLMLFIANYGSYISAIFRVSIATPLVGDEGADDEASARGVGTCIATRHLEGGTASVSQRSRTKHSGYLTSNGLGSLEVGGADD